MPNAQCELAGNFTRIPNDLINDRRLSAKARALLTYLLSKPVDWKLIAADCARALACCVRTVRKVIAECIGAGYLDHRRFRSGRTNWTWHAVSTKPQLRRPIQMRLPFMDTLKNGVARAAKTAENCLSAKFASGKNCLPYVRKNPPTQDGPKNPEGGFFGESVTPDRARADDCLALGAAITAHQPAVVEEGPRAIPLERLEQMKAEACAADPGNAFLHLLVNVIGSAR
jgi:hypothetical protein